MESIFLLSVAMDTNLLATQRLHFDWKAKVWQYLTLDCEEDEKQEEDKEEVRSLLLGIIEPFNRLSAANVG